MCVVLAPLLLVSAGCFENEKGETYYGRVEPPRAQEFRWSNGGLPRVFDPALAAAPPDTDAVRALFEGLTDYDPVSLKPVAAVATRWEASEDKRVWTFQLRRDARWSNGDAVTAKDFVRSWQRTLRLGDRAPHARLLENLEGARSAVALVTEPSDDDPSGTAEAQTSQTEATGETQPPEAAQSPTPDSTKTDAEARAAAPRNGQKPAPSPPVVPEEKFGAEALGDYVLRVRLKRPDEHFPALVAHPVFRPVHETSVADEPTDAPERKNEDKSNGGGESSSPSSVVSNGAFRLTWSAADGVVLERASEYWDAGAVELERVRFVPARNAEEALAAYRKGEVDAVTNAAFQPLALKLLAPYKDFRRATYGALTYYSFNLSRRPFDDRRVREALAIALDRERLSADVMSGATEPARKFLPETGEAASGEGKTADKKTGAGEGSNTTEGTSVGGAANGPAKTTTLEEDAERARSLLAEAGFPDGVGFPRVRLLINRNEQQRRMAQAVAAMWRERLNVETEVVVLGWDEYEAALWTGDYDVARRSMVMQTTDEASNMLSLFDRAPLRPDAPEATGEASATTTPVPDAAAAESSPNAGRGENLPAPLLTEEQALRELPAFPVYFASSYALVKPYVRGFDANLLDAPSLKRVR
ncbi:MAG TPA: ABC transporter substrate-binding protein, partial [Pyrinomonadaceae bacterium]|nr:ABC transporter substrate-binding protein [Pyrinomonadaceae bacterium]